MRKAGVIVTIITLAASVIYFGLSRRTGGPGRVADRSQSTIKPEPTRATSEGPGRRRLDLQMDAHGRGSTTCGGELDDAHYKSSDGVTIAYMRADLCSPAGAARELRRELRGAIKIIERHAELNGEGKKVGVRVVAAHRRTGCGVTVYSVAWTSKTRLTRIESNSLDHALEFEKEKGH